MKASMRKILAAALVCCMLPACGPSASSVPAGSGGGAAQPTPQPSEPTFSLDESVHPYTGLEKEEGYPEGKRGVAVMINNVKTALPQSGINSADLLYEMVTEGGITRLMAVYRNTKEMPVVGPVRSARDQHVQLAIPLNCLYAHIGGSTYALDMLEVFKYPDRVSINGKYKNFYWIDAERRKTLPQESCVYTDGRTFNDAAQRYGLEMEGEPLPAFNFVPYNEEPRELTGGKALEISIRFSGYEDSQLNFDPVEGRYFKYEFGEPQIDTADGSKTYSAENVFLLFADITQYPDRVLAKVNMNNGAGLYFCNGRYERVRWMKGAGEQPLRIVDNKGNEVDVQVNPGNSYIAIVGMDQLEYCRVDGMNLEELFTKTGTL